jgi:hypothetical protein
MNVIESIFIPVGTRFLEKKLREERGGNWVGEMRNL